MLHAIPRFVALGLTSLALALLAGACSSEAACQPRISEGQRFRITIGPTTAKSMQNCVVAKFLDTPYFDIEAAQTHPSSTDPDCSATPAKTAPPVNGVTLAGCVGKETGMLGTTCQIQYPGGCKGVMSFYLASPTNSSVDWSASRIEGLVLRIEDTAVNCIANASDCVNEYAVVVDRI